MSRQTRPWLLLTIACVAQYLIPVMVTGVAVILPSAGRELHASALQLGLVEQTYVLATAVSMLFFGRLGDIFGWRRIYIVGFVCFTAPTGALGLAPDIATRILVRALQGLSAASILSGSVALVSLAYPPDSRGKKIGILQAFIYGGLSSGPLIGGFVASSLGWRCLFWLFVPFGLAGAVLCLVGLHVAPTAGQGRRPVDWKGAALYALGLSLLAGGASHADKGLAGLLAVVLGAAVLWAFCRLQSRTAAPLLDLHEIVHNRTFALSCLAAMGNYASTFGLTFFMSLYLQYSMNLSPTMAGLVLLCMPVTQMLASPFVGRLADKRSPVPLATCGMAVTCLGLVAAAATLDAAMPLPLLVVELLFVGAGYGIFITPNTVIIMGSVPRERYGLASGMVGTMRTLGMVLSMTTITVLLSLCLSGRPVGQETMPAFLACMRLGLCILALYSLLGIVTSSRRSQPADDKSSSSSHHATAKASRVSS